MVKYVFGIFGAILLNSIPPFFEKNIDSFLKPSLAGLQVSDSKKLELHTDEGRPAAL